MGPNTKAQTEPAIINAIIFLKYFLTTTVVVEVKLYTTLAAAKKQNKIY